MRDTLSGLKRGSCVQTGLKSHCLAKAAAHCPGLYSITVRKVSNLQKWDCCFWREKPQLTGVQARECCSCSKLKEKLEVFTKNTRYWCLAQRLGCYWGCICCLLNCFVWVPALLQILVSCQWTLMLAGDGSSRWISAKPWGDVDCVEGFVLSSAPVLAVVGIWGVNQGMADLCLSACLFPHSASLSIKQWIICKMKL